MLAAKAKHASCPLVHHTSSPLSLLPPPPPPLFPPITAAVINDSRQDNKYIPSFCAINRLTSFLN
jgi:hypothetical protein